MKNGIKVIGFDADDTLWINEPNYIEAENELCLYLKPYLKEADTSRELFSVEMQNLETYGFGAKSFILSMIETAIKVTNGKVPSDIINKILEIGKVLINKPVVLLEGVEEVLLKLNPDYKLILATKGDLLDQERKLEKSGLTNYFHHIEIMSDKFEFNYKRLLNHLDIQPAEFVMIGNSIKSDIIPVVNIGAKAIHVPYEITWLHEQNHPQVENYDYITIEKLTDLLELL